MPLSRITSPFQSATANVYSPSANTVAIRTASADRFTIDSSGRGSLGTTPSNWGSGGTLEFTGQSLGSIHNTGGFANFSFSRNAFFNPSSSFWNYKATANAALYQIETEAHNFYGAASGTASTPISWTQLLSFERGKTLALQGATTQTGTGITFPASQSASSDSNTLDDYEEGTWTPVLSSAGGAMTYTLGTTVARYTKVGNRVFFSVSMQFSNRSGGSNSVFLSLPFQVSTVGGYWQGVFTTGYTGNAFTVNHEGVSYTDPGQTNMFFRNAADQVTLINANQMNASGHLILGGQYETN